MKLLVFATLVGCVVGDLVVSLDYVNEKVRYEVHNNGNDDVSFLTHETPFEIFQGVFVGDPLQVLYIEGPFEVPYLGVMVRRQSGPPPQEDYLNIKAGDSIQVDVDITASYDMSVKGKYAVTVRRALGFSYTGALVIEVDEGLDKYPEVLVEEPYFDINMTDMKNCGRPVQVARCTTTQANNGREAYRLASVALPQLRVYNDANPRDALSIRWFGGGGTGLTAVQSGFRRMQQLLCLQGTYSRGSRFNCDNSCNYLAYVYPGDSTYTIYVCPPHFRTPMVGYTSQSGSIVHEASHFNPIMRTRDVIYGCSGSQNLARNNPTSARGNADNVCYMVEFGGILGPVPNIC